MPNELWTPGGMVPVQSDGRMALPDAPKREGGTFFDDELETAETVEARVQRQMLELINHLRERPDHYVYVGSVESRDKMRATFNVWKKHGLISHNPTIKIEYGVPEEGIRVAE